MTDIVNAVLVTGSVDKLRTSIEAFNSQTAIQNKRMLQLTYVIAFLTFVMLVAVGAQIYLSVVPSKSTTQQSISYNKSLNLTGAKIAPSS